MTKTLLLGSPPVVEPAAAPTAPELFPPSAELGDQLGRLAEAQVVIDRRQAEELAKLRAIQNRD